MDDGYVPQSPDLSALHNPPAPAPTSHPHLPQANHNHHLFHHQHHQQLPPQHQPYNHSSSAASAPFPAAAASPTSDPTLHTRESFSLPGAAVPRPNWPTPPHDYTQPQPGQDPFSPYLQHQQQPPPYGAYPPPGTDQLSAPRGGQLKQEPSSAPYGLASPAMAPASKKQQQPQPVPVIKTKFPIARIKRIVQADEDVGKVAQATPVAVSKALEQFMITLAHRAADEARARGSKKVTALDMKTAVSKDDVFDFLADVVDRVPDAPTKKGSGANAAAAAAAAASGSRDTDSEDEGARPKRRRAPRRRKQESSDDDDD